MHLPRSKTTFLVRTLIRQQLVPILCVFLAFSAEVFIFNLPYWLTRNAMPVQAVNEGLGPGLVQIGDGKARVTDPAQAWMDISASDRIEYLYLNPGTGRQQRSLSSDAKSLSWTTSTKKPTESGWYHSTAPIMFSPDNEMTRYSHIGGGATNVRLIYKANVNDTFTIPSFTVNPRVPFRLSWPRVALEAVLVLLIVCFRPNSPLYRRRLASGDIVCWAGMFILLIIEICAVIKLWLIAGGSDTPIGLDRLGNGQFFDNGQYNHMADALINGHVALDMPVNKDLAALSNPYDTWARTQIAATGRDRTPILFDTAFKSGKYYSYFGVLPALFMFAPFKMITGAELSVGSAILILALINTIMSMVVAIQIARLFSRSKSSCSLGAVMLISCAIFMGLQIINLVPVRLFYQIPQTMARAFVLIAISCWVQSKLSGLNKAWLALGSLAMAMTLGCRPQFMLAAIVAIPLFWEEIRGLWLQGRTGVRGLAREAGVWACALLPVLLVFAPLLAYNKVRFGSYLDFGSNYNLTGFDMPNSSLPYTQLFPMIFLYFLQPPVISTFFPLVAKTPQPLPLWAPMQNSYGGYLTTIAPFALILFLLPKWRVCLKTHRVSSLCWFLGFYAVVVFFFDVHAVGYDARYLVDWGWALMLLFAMLFMSIDSERKIDVPKNVVSTGETDCAECLGAFTELSRVMIGLVTAGMALGVILNLLQLQAVEGTSLWWDVYSWFLFV